MKTEINSSTYGLKYRAATDWNIISTKNKEDKSQLIKILRNYICNLIKL